MRFMRSNIPKISCSMPKQWKHQEILWLHAILRGGLDASGKNIPNYHYEDLLAASKRYSEMGLQHPFILVDTNHDNSGKQFKEQSTHRERNHDEPCLE